MLPLILTLALAQPPAVTCPVPIAAPVLQVDQAYELAATRVALAEARAQLDAVLAAWEHGDRYDPSLARSYRPWLFRRSHRSHTAEPANPKSRYR
jgi:hypothetical protein